MADLKASLCGELPNQNSVIPQEQLRDLLERRGIVEDPDIPNAKARLAEQELRRNMYHNTQVTPEQREACSALLVRLERAEAGAAGVTAKGFQAIRMLMDGYTNREIGEMFGVPANHVTAWVSRARKALGASE